MEQNTLFPEGAWTQWLVASKVRSRQVLGMLITLFGLSLLAAQLW